MQPALAAGIRVHSVIFDIDFGSCNCLLLFTLAITKVDGKFLVLAGCSRFRKGF
jgi:hypothetical protein